MLISKAVMRGEKNEVRARVLSEAETELRVWLARLTTTSNEIVVKARPRAELAAQLVDAKEKIERLVKGRWIV